MVSGSIGARSVKKLRFLRFDRALGNRTFEIQSKNNWTLIRLLAAIGVIYGHSFGMFPKSGHQDITIKWITHGITYSGQIAVIIFFFLSGAIVSGSLFRSSPITFLIKRIARLLPGLSVCLVVTVSVSYLIFSQVSPIYLLKYVVFNILNTFNIGQFPHIGGSFLWEVPGVFTNHPYKAINGSLWTLPQEFRLYFFIFMISILLSQFSKRQFLAVNTLVIFFLFNSASVVPWIGSNDALLGNQDAVINSIFFLIGSSFYLIEVDRLKSPYLLLASTFLYFLWLSMKDIQTLFFLSIIFFVMFLSKISVLQSLKLSGDYSYGVYLYGWPTGQFLYHFSPTLIPEVAFMLTSIIAILIAIPSWHLVESKVLNIVKNRLSTRGGRFDD